MPAAPATTAELLALVRKSGVVAPARLAAAVPDAAALPPQPQRAAGVLVQRGVLTKFQAQQLLAGRHKGFRLGQYAVLDLLGRGGMGAVYLAEHLDLHRKVAIKVLAAGKGDDQRLAAERFMREARSVAALDHPNIVRIFDVARHNDVPYLVMEYVDGDTLQHVLDRDGPMHHTTAADAIAQAAAGLQHAHEKGFVHRDIKPANLIREKSGTVKILDMGLARTFDKDTDNLTERLDAGAVVGTADFIAPEQALNLPRIDIRADIYSLGASFYALVAGKPPFEGNTTQKLLHHQMTSAPHLSAVDATLPPRLASVVAKMLAKKPEDRYQTPADVIAALAPWLGNSSRVLAGLSRTNLGQGAELHAVLNGHSGRVAVAEPEVEVDPATAMRDTGAVASSETTRSPSPGRIRADDRREPAAARGRGKAFLFAGVAAAVVVGGAVAAWAAFGGKKADSPTADNGTAPAPPDAQTTPGPKPKDPPLPPPNTPTERVAFKLDLSNQKPFAIRSGLEAKPNNQKDYKELSKSGPGEPPAGWHARCWNVDTHMEFFADTADGPLLGLRNVRGQGSAMLFMPSFTCATGVCRLKIEYAAAVKDRTFNVRFKPGDGRPAWDVARPAVTRAGVWRFDEFVVDLKGNTSGYFEFHNSDPSPDAAVKVRALAVVEAPAGTPPTPLAPASPPAGPNYAAWKAGPALYALDVAGIEPFRVTKENMKRTAGDEEKLPAGVRCYCWKKDATGEFRREAADGVPVLTLTNLSDEMSGQFAFELEKEIKLDLKPGKAYRVTVGYATRNEARGNVAIQTTEYKTVGGVGLPNTAGQWKTAAAVFTRPEGNALRLTIDNISVGEGNAVLVWSVEVVELTPPK